MSDGRAPPAVGLRGFDASPEPPEPPEPLAFGVGATAVPEPPEPDGADLLSGAPVAA